MGVGQDLEQASMPAAPAIVLPAPGMACPCLRLQYYMYQSVCLFECSGTDFEKKQMCRILLLASQRSDIQTSIYSRSVVFKRGWDSGKL